MQMTPSQTDLGAQKLDAEFREAEAKLQVLQATAEARKAKVEMDEISGLAAAKERVKKDIADMKQQTAANFNAAKLNAQQGLEELQAKIQRANDRFSAWDEARERRLNARLDEADAHLEIWKAKADQKRAEQSMKRHDDLAKLEEKIATARASAAEARRERYTEKAVEALNDAESYFEQAFEAAQKRYT
jgi:hypothetical protein